MAGVIGAAHMVIDHVLAPERVERPARAAVSRAGSLSAALDGRDRVRRSAARCLERASALIASQSPLAIRSSGTIQVPPMQTTFLSAR